jgi:hypothetical protein
MRPALIDRGLESRGQEYTFLSSYRATSASWNITPPVVRSRWIARSFFDLDGTESWLIEPQREPSFSVFTSVAQHPGKRELSCRYTVQVEQLDQIGVRSFKEHHAVFIRSLRFETHATQRPPTETRNDGDLSKFKCIYTLDTSKFK